MFARVTKDEDSLATLYEWALSLSGAPRKGVESHSLASIILLLRLPQERVFEFVCYRIECLFGSWE